MTKPTGFKTLGVAIATMMVAIACSSGAATPKPPTAAPPSTAQPATAAASQPDGQRTCKCARKRPGKRSG